VDLALVWTDESVCKQLFEVEMKQIPEMLKPRGGDAT
jgi:hypothetical protein